MSEDDGIYTIKAQWNRVNERDKNGMRVFEIQVHIESEETGEIVFLKPTGAEEAKYNKHAYVLRTREDEDISIIRSIMDAVMDYKGKDENIKDACFQFGELLEDILYCNEFPPEIITQYIDEYLGGDIPEDIDSLLYDMNNNFFSSYEDIEDLYSDLYYETYRTLEDTNMLGYIDWSSYESDVFLEFSHFYDNKGVTYLFR